MKFAVRYGSRLFGKSETGRQAVKRFLDQNPGANVAIIHREHVSSPDCWCQPEPDHIEPDLYIHRERH